MVTSDQLKQLVTLAAQARTHAYAPYSHYRVGAALLAGSGATYTGANVENAVYPVGTCAERSAMFHAASCGERELLAIAVVTEKGGSPCGACRQVLAEFGIDAVVAVADAEQNILLKTTVAALLPHAFGASDLNAT